MSARALGSPNWKQNTEKHASSQVRSKRAALANLATAGRGQSGGQVSAGRERLKLKATLQRKLGMHATCLANDDKWLPNLVSQ